MRLKALEGLASFSSSDETVRKALTQALLTDANPAVRIQAIDLLTKDRDEALVGVLQDIVRTEDNNYVRLKCRDALRQMNASVNTMFEDLYLNYRATLRSLALASSCD